MWWPAIGGLAIGVGGLIFPQALGVGYDHDRRAAARRRAAEDAARHPAVKIIDLGESRSVQERPAACSRRCDDAARSAASRARFPPRSVRLWPLVSMGAILGGTMRSPLTGIIFAIELTHDLNMMLP